MALRRVGDNRETTSAAHPGTNEKSLLEAETPSRHPTRPCVASADQGEPALVQLSSLPAGVHAYTPRSAPRRNESLRAT